MSARLAVREHPGSIPDGGLHGSPLPWLNAILETMSRTLQAERWEWAARPGRRTVGMPALPRALFGRREGDNVGGISWSRSDAGEDVITISLGRNIARFISRRLSEIDRNRTQKRAEHCLALLQSAVELAGHADAADGQHRALACALDHCPLGIVLLGADDGIRFENLAATTLLDRGTAVRRRGGGLTAIDSGDAVKLKVAIERAPALRHRNQATVISLKDGSGDSSLIATVAVPDDADGSDVETILHLFDPSGDHQALLRAACRLHGLSRVESALASEIVSGSSLGEAAATIRVKEQTARSYLKQIFQKTKVNRQAALVRVLMSSMIALPVGRELETV